MIEHMERVTERMEILNLRKRMQFSFDVIGMIYILIICQLGESQCEFTPSFYFECKKCLEDNKLALTEQCRIYLKENKCRNIYFECKKCLVDNKLALTEQCRIYLKEDKCRNITPTINTVTRRKSLTWRVRTLSKNTTSDDVKDSSAIYIIVGFIALIAVCVWLSKKGTQTRRVTPYAITPIRYDDIEGSLRNYPQV